MALQKIHCGPRTSLAALAGLLLLSPAWAADRQVVLGAVAASPGAGQYGAIAYNPDTQAHGYSFNQGSRATAQARALRQCGAGCMPVITFVNGCAALALGSQSYGAARASSRPRAERLARKECAASDCVVAAWVCTDRNLP